MPPKRKRGPYPKYTEAEKKLKKVERDGSRIAIGKTHQARWNKFKDGCGCFSNADFAGHLLDRYEDCITGKHGATSRDVIYDKYQKLKLVNQQRQNLFESLNTMRKNGELCDFIIQTSDQKTLLAHSVIMCAFSTVLKSVALSNKGEGKPVVFYDNKITSATWNDILNFVYKGEPIPTPRHDNMKYASESLQVLLINPVPVQMFSAVDVQEHPAQTREHPFDFIKEEPMSPNKEFTSPTHEPDSLQQPREPIFVKRDEPISPLPTATGICTDSNNMLLPRDNTSRESPGQTSNNAYHVSFVGDACHMGGHSSHAQFDSPAILFDNQYNTESVGLSHSGQSITPMSFHTPHEENSSNISLKNYVNHQVISNPDSYVSCNSMNDSDTVSVCSSEFEDDDKTVIDAQSAAVIDTLADDKLSNTETSAERSNVCTDARDSKREFVSTCVQTPFTPNLTQVVKGVTNWVDSTLTNMTPQCESRSTTLVIPHINLSSAPSTEKRKKKAFFSEIGEWVIDDNVNEPKIDSNTPECSGIAFACSNKEGEDPEKSESQEQETAMSEKLENFTESNEDKDNESEEDGSVYESPRLCVICGDDFQNERDFICHSKEKHSDVDNKCPFCFQLFVTKRRLRFHFERCRKERECDVCGKVLPDKIALKQHRKTKHVKLPFKCVTCNKRFVSLGLVQIHIRKDHKMNVEEHDKFSYLFEKTKYEGKGEKSGNSKWECPLCEFTADHLTNIEGHIWVKHKGRKQPTTETSKCTICGFESTTKENLKIHIINIHTKEKKFCCEVCGKTFKHNYQLNSHMNIHSDVKKYICSFCNQAFAQRWYLQQHERLHTGDKPYVCDFCGEAFTQKTGLNCHLKKHKKESNDS